MRRPYTKTYSSPADCIALLRARGLSVEDEGTALNYLRKIGYYQLSAYWYPFRRICKLPDNTAVRCDMFVEDARFQDAVDFYLFDKSLRLQYLDTLERIEIYFRAALVDTLGAINPIAHRTEENFAKWFITRDEDGESRFSSFLRGQDENFSRSKEDFSKHFAATYNGFPPIWIAAGAWDWGKVSFLFGGIRDKAKELITENIDPRLKYKTVASWLAALNEIRNTCAHHSRLWNKVLTNSPSFQKGEIREFSHLHTDGRLNDHSAKRLYGATVVTVFLMKKIHPKTEWHLRLAETVRNAQLARELSPHSAGFPEGWENRSI